MGQKKVTVLLWEAPDTRKEDKMKFRKTNTYVLNKSN